MYLVKEQDGEGSSPNFLGHVQQSWRPEMSPRQERRHKAGEIPSFSSLLLHPAGGLVEPLNKFICLGVVDVIPASYDTDLP